MATIGHPLSDMAYLSSMYYLPVTGRALGGLLGLDLPDLGLPTLDQLLTRYSAGTGVLLPGPYWDFHLGFYYFKGAIIAQGIIARLVKGAASNDSASAFAIVVPTFGELAHEAALALRDSLSQGSSTQSKL